MNLPCSAKSLTESTHSWKKALSMPWAAPLAAIDQPVMQAERPVAPEFDFGRHQPEAGPVTGPGHFAQRIFGGVFGDLSLERPAPHHGARLRRGPGPDLAVLGARGEIGVGFRGADFAHRASHPHRPAQALPMEIERGMGISSELIALGAFLVGIKDKPV